MTKAIHSTRREFVKLAGTLGATAALGPFVHARPARADKGELVVVSWGGSWAKSLREVMFTPFEKETGYRVRDDGPPEGAKLKAMVDSGTVSWDVLDTDLPAVQTMVKDGLLEPINYAKLDRGKLDRIPKPLHTSHGIGHKIYSFNIVYNTKTFPTGRHPRTWAEVWDGQKFKGGRSFNFRGGIGPQLEMALLADGLTIDKLYPLDVERAWKSMDRLRPLVTKWYQSHAEAVQLITAGEVDIACTVGPRAVTAKRTGAPIDVDYNEGKLGSDYWCVVKGSKNQEVALQFINFALDGRRQAGMVKENPYGPSNSAAFEFLTREEARDLTTAPDNIKRQFWINEEWWGKVGPDGKNENQKQKERFAAWMLQK